MRFWSSRFGRSRAGPGAGWLLAAVLLAPACHKQDLVGPEDLPAPEPSPVAPEVVLPPDPPPVITNPAPETTTPPEPPPSAAPTPAPVPPRAPAAERTPPKPAASETPAKPPAAAEAPAQTPRLLPDTPADAPVRATLARAEQLLTVLRQRVLTQQRREERDAGVTFIAQAREALVARDPARATVLADKAVALIENLELATRP